VKQIIIGDIHLGTYSRFGKNHEHGISQRLYEQKLVLKSVLDFVEEYKPDRVILGGDIFHADQAIPIEALNIADWFFKKLNALTLVYAVRGNHDLTIKEDSKQVHYSVAPFLQNYLIPNEVFLCQ
jgi:metallophosphoesterase superfamily enzyme